MQHIHVAFIHTPILLYIQLHGNVEEDLERLKLEEAAMQRRKKLQDGRSSLGVANGGRLSVDGDQFTLAQLQKKKKELGEKIKYT